MKFIRKNGRIIPIRDSGAQEKPKSFSGAHYKGMAIAAASQAVIGKGRPLAKTLGTITGLASNINAIQHGRQEHSFKKGVGRQFKNDFAMIGGYLATAVGITLASKGLRSSAVRGAARKAGAAVFSKSSGMKNVTPHFKRLSGK